jgi:hypothetical protein
MSVYKIQKAAISSNGCALGDHSYHFLTSCQFVTTSQPEFHQVCRKMVVPWKLTALVRDFKIIQSSCNEIECFPRSFSSFAILASAANFTPQLKRCTNLVLV